MVGPATPPQARRPGVLAGLSTGWTTFLVVDAILVVTFLVLLAMQVAGGQPGQSATPQAPSASTEPETSPEPTAPTVPDENQGLTEFILPSGNVWCSMTETSATCVIAQFSYTPPGKPADCTGAVGQVFEVTAEDGATLPCVQEVPPRPQHATALEYGQASTVGEMTCSSSKNGATCRHNPTGDGFSVARAGYTIL